MLSMGLVRVRFLLLLALPFHSFCFLAMYLQAITTASTCMHRRKTVVNNAVLLCHCDALLTRLVFWQAFSFWGTFLLWCAAALQTLTLPLFQCSSLCRLVLTSCSWAQLPANILILYIGAPNLLAIIICAWGTVGAATGTF